MNKKIFFILLAALFLRLSVIFLGFHGDLNNNISWGLAGYKHGLQGFYEHKIWQYSAPNQPPLYILLFVLLRYVWEMVNSLAFWLNLNIAVFPSTFIWFWENRGMALLVKLPSIIADIAIGFLIFNFLKKYKPKWAVRGLILWLFNPLVWYNSAVWGQTDAIVNLLGLLGIFSLLDKQLTKSAVWFTLSFLFKGSLAIFAPALIFIVIKQKYSYQVLVKALLASLFMALLVSVLFYPYPDLFIWLFNLYKDRILPGEIGFLTANAFNFWWLIDSSTTYDSHTYLDLSARVWGYVISLGLILPLLFRLKKPKVKQAFFVLALSALITFLFMTRIHERYLYPFFPVATIAAAYYPTVLPIYLILSITHLLNLYHLFWVPNFKFLENLYLNSEFMVILSIVQILGFVYLYYLYFKLDSNK